MERFGLTPSLDPVGDWVTFGAPEGSDPSDWVYLGRLSEYGKQAKVRFAVRDEKVIAIFGKRGQGKSFTLGTLLEGLALDPPDGALSEITQQRSVLLIDPLNVFQWIDIALTDDAAEHSPELASQVARAREWGLDGVPIAAQIFFPAGFRGSVFRRNAQELRLGVSDFTLDEWAALFDFDVVRDIRGQLVAEVFTKVTADGWDSASAGRIEPLDNPEIDDYMECVRDDVQINAGIYTNETIRAVAQRLRSIAAYDVFRGVGTPLTDLLRPGQISVLLLNGLPEDLRHVVVSVLARRIIGTRAAASGAQKDLVLSADLSAAERAEREAVVQAAPPKTWIVIDEAQDLIPAGRKTAATEALVKLVKEGRNFGLSLVITTQQPRAVDSRVLSQVETFLVHKLVSRGDIDVVIESLKCPIPTEMRRGDNLIAFYELVGSLSVGQVLLSDTYAKRCAVVSIRARVGAHGGFEA